MGADARAVVEAADASDDRFVAMQGLSAISYSTNFRGMFGEGEAALRRAAAIAREDDKAYRLTVVLGGLALGLALQGRVAETGPMFEEAKATNPDYRDSILVELEALVHWIAGDFPASLAAAREVVAWLPSGTARRRVPGIVFGALSAIELGDIPEADRLHARARAALGDRDWSFHLPTTRAAEAVLAWHAGRPTDCVVLLQAAVARLLESQAAPLAALLLFELAEAAADAGDAAAAQAAAVDLSDIARSIALPLYRAWPPRHRHGRT